MCIILGIYTCQLRFVCMWLFDCVHNYYCHSNCLSFFCHDLTINNTNQTLNFLQLISSIFLRLKVFQSHFRIFITWCFYFLSSQVVFNQAQIRMFTYDQAVAVTEAQRSALSSVQQTALSMVLNPWEDKPIDFRGTLTPVVKKQREKEKLLLYIS